MERILCIAIGYGFGLFQTGYIYGRMHGIDIRKHGSGNAGSTNMLRTLGVKAGLFTFLGDVLKCMLAVLVTYFLFKNSQPELTALLKLYTAAGVILGHNFPFYLKFKGGKGIAATAGLIFSFDPIMVLLGVATFLTVYFLTHYVSLGSLCVYIGIMIELIFLGQTGHFGLAQPALYELYAVGAFLSVMAFYRHRANIGRLLKGTETKTYLKKKKQD